MKEILNLALNLVSLMKHVTYNQDQLAAPEIPEGVMW